MVAEEAGRRDVAREILVIGRVEAVSTIQVRPQVGGVITVVHFREGSDVHRGDPLFTIDPRPYEAVLAQAEATLARDEAQLRNARIELTRADTLWDQGILSRERFDELQSGADALLAATRADRAAIDRARLDLEYARIASPIDGRTGSLLVHQGNLVKAIDGGPLVTINQLDPIYVSVAVPERRLVDVKQALGAGELATEAVIPGQEATPLPGRLTFVNNEVDRETGTVRLKAVFPNPARRLWPGLFVNVRLRLGMRKGAVVVPSRAIQTGQAGSYVFVVDSDQKAALRPVVAEPAGVPDLSVVEQGLEAGENVVTEGQLRLVPGAKVAIKSRAGRAS